MNNFVVCVTGGIASGKTLVSDLMSLSGFKVVDADIIARQVVAKGEPLLNNLVDFFGSDILLSDGSLNRKKLKKMVFEDKKKLSLLNESMHPAIQERIMHQLLGYKNQLIALVIPLFQQSMIGLYGINRVLVVDVAESIQMKRIQQRDGVDASLAQNILDAQSSRLARLKFATDVLVNNESKEQLNNKINMFVDYVNNLKNYTCH